MLSSAQPTRVSIPFANTGTKRTIPNASQIGITDGAASFTDGFPPKTFLPVAVGGVPPAGADFNGILNQVTNIQRWQSAGGVFTWDSAFSVAVGGYPNGARVLNAAGTDIWTSNVDNNLTNPDTGGAGWTLGSASLGYANGGTRISTSQALDLLYYGIANVMNPKFAGGAKCDGATDDTAAIAAALAASTVVYIPGLSHVTADLHVSKPYAVLLGNGKYSGCGLVRTGGTGTVLTFDAATLYPSMRGMVVQWTPTVGTDVFNTGTNALDTTAANTSLDMGDVWLKGCQTLVNGNYNSFYNRAFNCRFENTTYVFNKFSVNNFNIQQCRFKTFVDAFTLNGTGGPANIENNAFEVFSGRLVSMTGVEQGNVHFHHNYVETYDTELLPTNFPAGANALPGHFGGNVLFAGWYGTLSIKYNELGLGGVYIMTSIQGCQQYESVGNNMHFYTSGNNLLYLVNIVNPVQSLVVNDHIGAVLGAAGGYATTYNQAANIPTLTSPYGAFDFFDVVLNKPLLCASNTYTPTLINGWTSAGAANGVPAIIFDKKGLFLQGELTGTASTNIIAFILPAAQRPLELSQNRSFCFLSTAAGDGGGNIIQLRYIYGTGEFRLENSPASKANIVLDGLFIPARI